MLILIFRETGDKFTKRHSFTHCFTSEHNILVINISHRQSLPVLIRTISLADIAIVVLSPSYSALSDTHYLAASALGLKHILFAIDEVFIWVHLLTNRWNLLTLVKRNSINSAMQCGKNIPMQNSFQYHLLVRKT